jgi:hypothetical protein
VVVLDGPADVRAAGQGGASAGHGVVDEGAGQGGVEAGGGPGGTRTPRRPAHDLHTCAVESLCR